MEKESLEKINKNLNLLSWWLPWLVIPISNRITLFFLKYPLLTPNQITITGSVLKICSGLFFIQGRFPYMVFGSLFYYISFVLDCVDGPLARITGRQTEKGRYLDHFSDLIGDLIILCGLLYGQGLLFSIVAIAMCIMHICEAYISYMTGMAMHRKADFLILAQSNNLIVNLYKRYRNYFFQKNLKSFISFPDYEFLLFIVFPVLGVPEKGILIGFFVLVIVLLYTIFSTFWCFHSGDGKFP